MRIAQAPKTAAGFFEARPSDVAGRTDLVLIDVREAHELLGELGHIHGVRNVPARVLAQGALSELATDTPIVVVCRTGAEGARACAELVRRGFREVYNLTGGMVRWNAEERPVARAPTWK